MAQGCRPLTARDVMEWSFDDDELLRFLHTQMARDQGRAVSVSEVRERLELLKFGGARQASNDVVTADELDGSVVLSAEEVADYWASLPAGTRYSDVFDVVVPPFDRLFVEFQNRPVPAAPKLGSWAVLVTSVELEHDNASVDRSEAIGDGSSVRWAIGASLIGEFEKGRPVGALSRWVIRLDHHGKLLSEPEGLETLFAFALDLPGAPRDAFATSLMQYHLGPALFAISLMHCKNVDLRSIDPPERLSRKNERKYGRPLTRYHILDIQPMRETLDTEGEAQTKGLRHALHICRGHFKTFTEDAPLFGRHTGTYWWASQVRGKAEHGIIEKDYRIRLDRDDLGREYVEVDEHPEIERTASEHVGIDPDLGGRGLKAHNVTQNRLAAAVRAAGFEPRRPKPDEPQYDLAWGAGETTWVAEVKSITPQNEERQLRLALGQVIRYRQLLSADGRTVEALIAVEREPSDLSWSTLLAQENVALVWPGQMEIVAR